MSVDLILVFGYSDGKLDIVVPSFVHYLEVLEGADGDKMPGTSISNDVEPRALFVMLLMPLMKC